MPRFIAVSNFMCGLHCRVFLVMALVTEIIILIKVVVTQDEEGLCLARVCSKYDSADYASCSFAGVIIFKALAELRE